MQTGSGCKGEPFMKDSKNYRLPRVHANEKKFKEEVGKISYLGNDVYHRMKRYNGETLIA